MTGEPEGLGLYGMVTPFGGDYGNKKHPPLTTEVTSTITQKIINHHEYQ